MDHHEQEYIRNPKFRDLEKEKKKERRQMKKGYHKTKSGKMVRKVCTITSTRKKKFEPSNTKAKKHNK